MNELTIKIASFVAKIYVVHEEKKKLRRYEQELRDAKKTLEQARKYVQTCEDRITMQKQVIKEIKESK